MVFAYELAESDAPTVELFTTFVVQRALKSTYYRSPDVRCLFLFPLPYFCTLLSPLRPSLFDFLAGVSSHSSSVSFRPLSFLHSFLSAR